MRNEQTRSITISLSVVLVVVAILAFTLDWHELVGPLSIIGAVVCAAIGGSTMFRSP